MEEWRVLKIESELAQGQYPQALKSAEEALNTHPSSLQLQLLGRTAHLYNGKIAEANAALAQIERFVVASPRRYAAPDERVALGRFLLLRGADPRQVLELMYDPVRRDSPNFIEAYLATAELALDKYDHALAAQTLRSAPMEASKDPRYHLLFARAYSPDDPVRTAESIAAAMAVNATHADSLLMRVDRLIDAEQYALAEEDLKKVLGVNGSHPVAWAYKAVIAHLQSTPAMEKQARERALAHWSTNPEVDHLIGKKLSQKYRFAEGAAYQRASLKYDNTYRPAKLQLSQDLLRLGDDEEGWRLADEVLERDAYNVVAFNISTLRKELAKFRTLRSDGLIVRMESREADLYGDRVLQLLKNAKTTLTEKYGFELNDPIVIEIFPRSQDFAVRTFGMPGAEGFLGVCFGRLITANSPASQGERPSNWEAVLWHEFCHVVTLHKTKNKMPRWLSEGISVYEERQANPGWGQAMNAQYRQMIVDGEMAPVSQLSSAFLAPKSPLHLQFAYFESAMVVEFLVERFGIDAIKQVLVDLGEGMEINESLIRRTLPLSQLDRAFEEYAMKRVETLAPNATWEEFDLPTTATAAAIAAWLKDHPKNIMALQRYARRLLIDKKFAEALAVGKQLQQLFPEDISAENAYTIMAAAHRELGDPAAERAALESLVARDGDATDANLRLIELGEEAGDWKSVSENARRLLAVNPLIVAPHRAMAKASEALGERKEAIRSYRALLKFDTTDPAHSHFRLATLLNDEGAQEEAKRQVLMALDEAPRYQEAHQLLLKLTTANGESTSAGGQGDQTPKAELIPKEAEKSTSPSATQTNADAKEIK